MKFQLWKNTEEMMLKEDLQFLIWIKVRIKDSLRIGKNLMSSKLTFFIKIPNQIYMFESVSTKRYRIPFLLKSLIFISQEYFCYQTSIFPANLIFCLRVIE